MILHQPILVLGMHRSGTSCLTGLLEEAGVYLGKVNKSSRLNKKGNQENFEVMALHNDILKRNGASWDHPLSVPPKWTAHELARLETIIETYPKDKVWGLKDPRTLFTIKGWEQLTRPQYVGTFRHPLEVAASLMFRAKLNNIPIDEAFALNLWAAYNRQLLTIRAQNPFPIIRYDIPMSEYMKKFRDITSQLGLSPSKVLTFRETELRHQRSDESIPDHFEGIWKQLNAYAV